MDIIIVSTFLPFYSRENTKKWFNLWCEVTFILKHFK